ncbi:MAG: glycogen debranching protein GlgX [Buchananella hordeovulneris]|nr:glycogen debranching protein GlgX [Buchananella hordeovulneris]MDO5081627.1 glycogen debranching protein GlgX [Buchananella hordeovulneris]
MDNGEVVPHASPFVPAHQVAQALSVVPPLGAHLTNGGATFAVFASHATAVDLCLIDIRDGQRQERRLQLVGPSHGVWHGFVPDIGAGQLYGYRVYGPWDPEAGLLHNPAKLLLDPYATGVQEVPVPCPELYPHEAGEDLYRVSFEPDLRDSLPVAPLGVVTRRSGGFHPGPKTPWRDTVIYEAHVRGLTKELVEVPPELRGTYAGLAHPATIAHLHRLGVTAVELLPIHAAMSEAFLVEKGLDNYWGYSTLNFFSPEPRYATKAAQAAGGQAVLDEVKGMVSILHDAGIEVLLDVVYNHTCEGGLDGLAVSWRGFDNVFYYAHDGSRPARLADFTGTGNSLDFRRPPVVRLALDSLRYWVQEVGIDGFRYDLATTLGRNLGEFSSFHPFLVALGTDPVLSQVKHIAEPWDVGPGGWRTGEFPEPFADWNDRYRDTVRQFWLADARSLALGGPGSGLADLATRIAGSADLFSRGELPGGRGPLASINFVTAHDGFTLRDLVTYDHKRNDANLEQNRDGTDNNRSWSHGVAGDGDEAAPLRSIRSRSMRNLLGTLLVSVGVPMLTAGDEMARTQQGNNNAYCQDNEISWLDWQWEAWQEQLVDTTAFLLRLRREHPVLRPTQFPIPVPRMREGRADAIADTSWYGPDGRPLADGAWHDGHARVMSMLRSGWSMGDRDLLVLINGSLDPVTVVLPHGRGLPYELQWDSTWDSPTKPSNGNGGQLEYDPMLQQFRVVLDSLSMQIYFTAPAQ